MTAIGTPARWATPLVWWCSQLAGGTNRGPYILQAGPDEADSPEIRCQLSQTAPPAPRSHIASSPTHHASRPADVYCPRNINLRLDIVLDQKLSPPLSPIATSLSHKLLTPLLLCMYAKPT
jgi:hypothetical protein